MAPSTQPASPPPDRTGIPGDITTADLAVQGTLPAGLSGRLLAIGPGAEGSGGGSAGGDGVVHLIQLRSGRAVSYRRRWVITDAVAQRHGTAPTPGPRHAGPDVVAGGVVAFGGSILAVGEGALAYQLSPGLDTLRRVDLAGQFRGLVGIPRCDAVTGDLHLLTAATNGVQAHVVVYSGALTRTTRLLDGAPRPITDLAVSRNHVVLACDGLVGVMARCGEAHLAWIHTDVAAPRLVHAEQAGDTVVVHAMTPSLERWVLDPTGTSMRRDVLDPAPWRFARTGPQPPDEPARCVWTAGSTSVDRHDLHGGSQVRHVFADGQPGDLEFVADAARHDRANGGWMLVLVHRGAGTDLVVLDAADLAGAPLAVVSVAQPMQHGVRSTWIPEPVPA
jgi:carotenoid cleavage dioxygenase-like enzyme